MRPLETVCDLISLVKSWLRISSKGLMVIVFFISISPSALASQKVTLLLDWFINPDHGPIIIAKEKGFFADRGFNDSYFKSFMSLILGTFVIFLLGIGYLGSIIGYDKAMVVGLYPFILSAVRLLGIDSVKTQNLRCQIWN